MEYRPLGRTGVQVVLATKGHGKMAEEKGCTFWIFHKVFKGRGSGLL